MKRFILFLILISTVNCYADSKITDMTPDASPSADDLMVTVNDPLGTPANRKVTLANLKVLINTAISSGNINWQDINRLVTINAGAINWPSVNGVIPGSGINWTDVIGLIKPQTSFATGQIPIRNLASGTPDGTKFVRDDGTLVTPSGSGSGTVNSATINQVAYYTGTGTAVSGNAGLIFNGTNVGVGSINPTQAIDINGHIKSNNALIKGWPLNQIATTATTWAQGTAAIDTAAANFGSGLTEYHVLDNYQQSRVRQNGTLVRTDIYLASKPASLTNFYFEVWRPNSIAATPTSWTLVSSQDVLASLAGATTNQVTLGTPITVQVGDYIGIGFKASSDPGNFLRVTSSSQTAASFGISGGTYAGTTNYDWTINATTSSYFTLRSYVNTAPMMVFVGDSLVEGETFNIGFYGAGAVVPTTNIPGIFPYKVANAFGVTYQEFGVGGAQTSAISGQLTVALALSPKIVVLEGGYNDIRLNTASATVLANWKTMLDACEVAGIIPVVSAIWPSSFLDSAHMTTVTQFNDDLRRLVKNYRSAIWVDPTHYWGTFKSGGDAGNLWNPQTGYTSDGTHGTTTGYTQIANAIIDAMSTVTTTQVRDSIFSTTNGVNATLGANLTNIGIGTITVPKMLTVGSTGVFQVDSTGQLPNGLIVSAGNVGIGSIHPGTALDILGTVRATGFVGDGSLLTGISGGGSVANPSATIGLVAVNGSASSAIRSDGAPALSQTIVPTWTGTHTFSGTGTSANFTTNVGISSVTPGKSLDVIGTVRAIQFLGDGSALTGISGSGTVNSSTVNQISRYSATGTAVTGSTNLMSDNTNVGISTTVPTARLQINNDALPFVVDSTSNVGIGTNITSNAALSIINGNIGIGTWKPKNTMDINSNAVIGASYAGIQIAPANGLIVQGNIGVGTFTTTQALTVLGGVVQTSGGSSTSAYSLTANSLTSGNGIVVSSSSSSVTTAGAAGSFTLSNASNNGNSLYTEQDGAGNVVKFTDQASDTSPFIIDAAGNVGIGTIAAIAKVSIVGNIGIGTTAGGGQYIATIPPNGGMIIEGNVGIGTWKPTHTLALGNGVISSQWGSPIPVLSSCGAAPSPSVKGTDQDFEITVGGTATACTATFGGTYADAMCTVTNQSMSVTNALTYTVSSTAVVISQAVGLSGDLIDVHCGFKN